MSDALRTKVVYLALAIGCVLSLSSLTVWVLRAEFGTAGASFLSAGCLLIGLSVFTRASIQAGPLKAEFESDANKRFAAIATTDVEMEKAVREALAAEGAAAQDPDELASSVLREVRSRAFLTLDTRPFLGAQGREVRAPYSDFESIGLFLRYAWFAMEGGLHGHSYTKSWFIKDLSSGHIFRDIGSRYAREELGTEWDERSLSEVGIAPGMSIGVVPASAL